MNAILYLHKKKLVHGNVKPENILIQWDSEIYDIAQIDAFDAGKSFRNKNLPANPYYCPIDEVINKKQPDNSSDLFALVMSLYRVMLENRGYVIDANKRLIFAIGLLNICFNMELQILINGICSCWWIFTLEIKDFKKRYMGAPWVLLQL